MRLKIGATLGAVATAASLLLLTPGLALARGEGGGEAVGSLSTGVFTTTFDVSQDSSDPHDVRGYVRAHPGPPGTPVLDGLGARGHVTCVHIEGDRVRVIYSIDEGSQPPFIRGQVIYAAAIDNHGHGPDEAGFIGGPPGLFSDCRPDFVPVTPVLSGHVTVRENR
jgi:hypothetical protein